MTKLVKSAISSTKKIQLAKMPNFVSLWVYIYVKQRKLVACAFLPINENQLYLNNARAIF